MSKKKDSQVKLKRNGVEKTMSTAQWEAMKKSGDTYGWKLASDVSKETLQKEESIEASKIKELKEKVETLTGENDLAKSELAAKDQTIKELKEKVSKLEAVNSGTDDIASKDVKGTPKENPKAAPKK